MLGKKTYFYIKYMIKSSVQRHRFASTLGIV